MNLFLTQFIKFCEKNDIKLLSEDIAYISRWISVIPASESKAVLSGYLAEWRKGMGLEENVQKKQGVGRRNANIWLQKECISICRR